MTGARRNTWKSAAVIILALLVAFTFMPLFGNQAYAATSAAKATNAKAKKRKR